MYRSNLAALLASALLCCCRSLEPFVVDESNRQGRVEISRYDPLLPGYHLRGDIGRLVFRPGTDSPPAELLLSIRTSTQGESHLERFALVAPRLTVSSAPGAEHEEVVTFSGPDGTLRSDTLVPAGTWFRFETAGETVRVHLLMPAMELLRDECRIEWVDWFRR